MNRDNICLWKHFHVDSWDVEYNVCIQQSEKIVNIFNINIGTHLPGSIICGDLTSLGWYVVTSVTISDTVQRTVSDPVNQGE